MSPARPLLRPLLLVSVLLLLLGACGDGDDSPPGDAAATGEGESAGVMNAPGDTAEGAPSPFDPADSAGSVCDLLTGEEATNFTGETMGEPSAQRLDAPLYQQVCTFGAEASGSYSLLQVSVVDETQFEASLAEQGYTARALWLDTRKLHPNAEVIPGLGDGAFRHGDTLEVHRGDFAIGVSIARNDGTGRTPVPLDSLVHLARVVLSRLDPGVG